MSNKEYIFPLSDYESPQTWLHSNGINYDMGVRPIQDINNPLGYLNNRLVIILYNERDALLFKLSN